MNKLIALVVLLVGAQAWAAAPELCGDGIDDPLATGGSANGTKGACPGGYVDAVIGNGCDLLCPAPDQDNDGYTTTDCDDTDRTIYDKVYTAKGCNAGYYRYCDAGTYRASPGGSTAVANGGQGCTNTTLCEATGTGVCKYIDAGAGGSDSYNGNYPVYSSGVNGPYKTLGKIAGGSPGSPPASPYTLQAGDVVYLMGTTAFSTQYSDGTRTTIANLSSAGTSANPITIKRYPGATAEITLTTGNGFYLYGAHYTKFVDIAGSNTANSLILSYANNVTVERSYIHDTTGNCDNNHAGIYSNAASHLGVYNSFFKDIYCTSGDQGTGLADIIIFNDPGITDASHTINRSVFWNTRTVNSSCSGTDKCADGIRFRHGAGEPDAGSTTVDYNYFIWPKTAISINTSGVSAKRNIIADAAGVAINLWDAGSYLVGQQTEFKYNTILNSQAFQYTPHYTVDESVTISNNVFVDDAASYDSSNRLYRIDAYGTDAHKTTFEASHYLTSNNNCFYNGTTAVSFGYFEAGEPAGAAYTFANWKGTVGQDAASYEENPTLNAYKGATSTNCTDKGWLAPTPTPTPTPTATATPAPPGLAAIRGRIRR